MLHGLVFANYEQTDSNSSNNEPSLPDIGDILPETNLNDNIDDNPSLVAL